MMTDAETIAAHARFHRLGFIDAAEKLRAMGGRDCEDLDKRGHGMAGVYIPPDGRQKSRK